MLTLEELDGDFLLEVKVESGKVIGLFIMDIDGFYYFEPSEGRGYYAAHNLREIANLLDEKNKPYRESIDKYFRENGEQD